MALNYRGLRRQADLLDWPTTLWAWAVVMAAWLVHFWLTAPLPPIQSPLSSGALFAAVVGWQALKSPRAVAWQNRKRTDGEGVWTTPLSARSERLALALPLAALAGYLGYLCVALTKDGEPVRAVAAAIWGLGSLAALVRAVILGWRRALELRIDETGVFTRRWRGTIPWEAIDFAVTPTDRERVLRLMTRPPLTAPGLPRATREGGGFVTIRLEDSQVSRDAVIAAMLKVRPNLRVAPWRRGGAVLPIRGATDVPDTVEVTTYG